VSRIRKKTFFLQFCVETPEGHQESMFNTSKVKKTKIHMGSIRQSLQAWVEQTIKKSTKSTNRNKKVKRSQKFVWGLPDEHQIYQSRTKNFPKKVCLVP
jgi:hypothetical protein